MGEQRIREIREKLVRAGRLSAVKSAFSPLIASIMGPKVRLSLALTTIARRRV